MVTDKRNQHYIPKFFLRRFSFREDEKTVGIYLPGAGRFVARGPLRSQAYRHYFYGQDGVLEDRLSQVEGMAAEHLRQLATAQEQPQVGSPLRLGALFHLLLSDLRTPAQAEKLQAQVNAFRDTAFQGIAKKPREYDQLRMSPELAVQYALDSVGDSLELCLDLEVRVIKNRTAVPFLTCDAPVLRYNQLLEKHQEPGGIVGAVHAGLQLFMPIDARTLLVAYDSTYYRIGARTNQRLSYCNERDVAQINLLSYLNCHSALFFNHEVTEDYLIQLGQQAARFPKPNQNVATKLYKVGSSGPDTWYSATEPANYKGNIVLHSYTTCLKTKLLLSFMQFTREYRNFVSWRTPANMRPHSAQVYARNKEAKTERPIVKFTYDEE
jgi:hypothetical protein